MFQPEGSLLQTTQKVSKPKWLRHFSISAPSSAKISYLILGGSSQDLLGQLSAPKEGRSFLKKDPGNHQPPTPPSLEKNWSILYPSFCPHFLRGGIFFSQKSQEMVLMDASMIRLPSTEPNSSEVQGLDGMGGGCLLGGWPPRYRKWWSGHPHL